MTDVRITCITLSSTNAVHEHITHVGSPQFIPQGSKWTVAQVINAIESKQHTFHVTDNYGNRANVGVVNPGGNKPKFIRTYADGKWNNNLLSLPQC
ncbi:DUF3892 domain-containing protein [Morganella morganii]|uniref:DUF3892 domain-containing protein n=1 Tax=Morganella morganii TaxID=582 RepID=UPI00280C672C|nr:DUF3892 domain-containing protein [Morganella morganii]